MKDYFKNVLFIGPDITLRGGMASVLEVYSKNFKGFNFLPTYHYKNPVLSILYFTRAVFKFIFICITNSNIKVIHIHSACRGSFIRKSIMVLLAKLFGKKALLHIHGGEFKVYYKESGFLKPYITYILNTADELLVLSEEWRVYFDSITKEQKSIVVNNPVEMPANVSSNIVSTPVKILYLNHLNEKKGILDIVEVFKNNKEAFINVFKLNIAGAGAELEKIQQVIKDNALEELIEYKGWVSGKDKDELIKDCNAFILTSYYEGLPMSILEAMSFGKPIISTDVGGIPGIVKPLINGWLLKAGDKEKLKDVLLEIKSNPSMLEQYGRNSFNIVDDFSCEKVAEHLNSIYEGFIDNKAQVLKKAKAFSG